MSEKVVIRILVQGLKASGSQLVEKWDKFLSDFFGGFPNPVKMIDAFITFASGYAGIVLTIPISGVRKEIMDLMKPPISDVGRRLIRFDDMMDSYFEMQIRLIKLVTGTGESDLTSAILAWGGRFVYNGAKRLKLLFLLSRTKTEAEFIEVLIKSWSGKLRLRGMIAIAGLIFMAFAYIGALWSLYSLAFISLPISKLLPQDSKRVYGKTSARHRVNKRKGYDS